MVAGRIQSLVRGGRNAILDLTNLKTEWIPRNLPPDPPTNVVLDSRHIGSNYWNNVSWDSPSDGGPVSGYDAEVRFRLPPPPEYIWDWQGLKRTPGLLTNDTNPIRGYQYQYRVRTVGPYGESVWVETNQVNVDVISPTDPVIDSFTVDDVSITSGESTTLRWTSSNATSATINGQSVPVDGTMSISPTLTTSYRLTVSALSGFIGASATQTITVDVTPASSTSAWLVTNLIGNGLWRINPDDPSDETGVYGLLGSLPSGLFTRTGMNYGENKWLVLDNASDELWRVNPNDPDDETGDYGLVGSLPSGLTTSNWNQLR